MRKIFQVFYLFIVLPIWADEINGFMQKSIPNEMDKSVYSLEGKKHIEVANPDKTCNLNSASIRIGNTMVESNITYIVCKENGKVIYTKTYDVNFESEEGYTTNSLVYELITKEPLKIFVEPGTCVFVQLKNEWRACISTTTNIDLMRPVRYFYKIDNEYTNYMSLEDWKEFTY